jgi:glycosyltransferase involved in cell wall biosynthesis
MTRIAFIAGTYQPKSCGVAHYTAHLRAELVKQEIASVVLTTHAAAQVANAPDVVGAIPDWHLQNLVPLLQAIHATKADILHIQHAAGTYGFDRSIFLLPLLLRLTGWRAPIVTTIHEYGWWEWQPRWLPQNWVEWTKVWGQRRGWWDREDGFLLTQSDAIITTNKEAQRILFSRLPQFNHRVDHIPIGANIEVAPVDRKAIQQKVRQDRGWSQDTQIVAFFGFLHPVKGLETLLPAFKQVLAVKPQTRLLLIGGVESLALPTDQATRYWNKLEGMITNLQLNHKVYMTGYLEADAASCYLSAANVGVLPFNHGVTLKSGSLLALMAHALPTIATHSTPPDPELPTELVRQIAPRAVDQLSTELLMLLEDVNLQQQLGAKGQTFSRKFAWSNIADAHQAIYSALLEQNVATASGTMA